MSYCVAWFCFPARPVGTYVHEWTPMLDNLALDRLMPRFVPTSHMRIAGCLSATVRRRRGKYVGTYICMRASGEECALVALLPVSKSRLKSNTTIGFLGLQDILCQASLIASSLSSLDFTVTIMCNVRTLSRIDSTVA